MADLRELLAVSQSKLERMKAAGQLPPSINLGSQRCVRFREADVLAWIEERFARAGNGRGH
jgi:predicted DNA-binding transcriptional regulator AlpA